MSTKILHSATEKETDIQKQVGCMNGIFQLFGRQNFLPSQRVTSHNHKRPEPGQNINHGMEKSGAMQATPVGQEKSMASVEPSRTSFSSSCSSSTFSSVDWNKKAQLEPSPASQTSFTKTTSPSLPMKQPSSFPHLSQQSLDLRDIVKGSMSREAHRLSIKTNPKDRGTTKHIDSPRPFQQHKVVHTKVTRNDGSLRNAAKFRDAQRSDKEQKYGSLPMTPREAPRYSYDERVSKDKLKLTGKLKELPRLSLDSRERAIRSSDSQSRSNYLSRGADGETRISSQILCLNHEPGSNKRPSTVVARLMGLEPTPDFVPPDETHTSVKTLINEDPIVISRSSRIHDESKQNQVTGSPRISQKIPSSPRSKSGNLAMKSTSSSKLPPEPALWKQTEINQFSPKQTLTYQEALRKSPQMSASVYGEIEKRLTELEFKTSGKDLRALKQILEAMEKTRERLENKKEEQVLYSESQTSKCSMPSSFGQESTQQNQINHHILPVIKASSSPKRHGSPIVIVKPNKQTQKPANPAGDKQYLKKKWSGDNANNIKELVDRRKAKDVAPKKNQLRDASSWPQSSNEVKTNAGTLRSLQHPNVPPHIGGENPAASGRSSRNLRGKLHKKQGTDKLSFLTTKSSELRRSRKQPVRHPMDTGSPTRQLKHISTNLQQDNDHLSWSSNEARNLNHQGDTVSMQSESGTSLASHIETEVTSKNHTEQITGCFQAKNLDEEDFTTRLAEDKLIAELGVITLEQPSPVSILDIFYEEDSPSPVKKRLSAFEDYETLNSVEAEWRATNIDHLQIYRRFDSSSRFDQEKLENIDQLIQKLRLVNCIEDEATENCIASVCDNNNDSEHIYIAEILVAAGLLNDHRSSLMTIQLHPSELPLNPKLFHILEKVLENAKLVGKNHITGAQSKASDIIYRKLLFDAVNEILARKSALTGSVDSWIHQNTEHSMRGDKLLKELCTKINHQQATQGSSLDDDDDDGLTSILSADMINEPENWALFSCEIPGIVLDIERMIFKDLIGDLVSSGRANGLSVHSGRHCRKLFLK